MMRKSVDLPLPLGPRRTVSEPPAIASETLSSAAYSPNRLLTRRTAIAIGRLLSAEEVHCEQGQHGEEGKHDRRRVGAHTIEILEAVLDVEGQRFSAALDLAGYDRDGAELAQGPRGRQDNAVRDPPADRGQRHAPEGREGRGAERPGRLVLFLPDLAQDGHDLPDDEGQ